MNNLVRLVYVSRAVFSPVEQGFGIEPMVTEILFESRRRNIQRGLVGVLYYGDGYFMQCIEGEKLYVDQLYEKIKKDPRHTDVRVLSYAGILHQAFDQWRMKYMPLDQQAKILLHRYGVQTFRPDQLSADAVSALLSYAAKQNDDSVKTQVLAEGRLLEDEMVRERTIMVLVIGFFVFLALFSISMIVLSLQLG